MDAALSVVAVERALVAVLRRQFLQLPQIVADALRGHRRVLPAFVRVGLARDERRRAQARLAHVPEVLLALRVVVELPALQALVLPGRGNKGHGLRLGFPFRLSAELDEE